MSGPPTIKGTFTLGSGAPLANAAVVLTSVDSVPTDGSLVTPTQVGTATTGADGSWSFTLPATLPSALQAYADANDGVLSLQATATGTAPDGTILSGSDYLDAGVATGPATTQSSADARAEAPLSVALHPLTVSQADSQALSDASSDGTSDPANAPAGAADGTPLETSSSSPDGSDDGSDATDPDAAPSAQWQSADGQSTTGYNPDVVGGKDYSAVAPAKTSPNACYQSTKVIKDGIRYTTVGESHAFYDAQAAFEFNDTLSESIGVEVSANGKDWSLSGRVARKSSTGHATGFTNKGPYWAKQWRVPIEFKETATYLNCGGGSSTTYGIVPVKYKVPSGGTVGEYGAKVTSHDGSSPYSKSKASYRGVIPRGAYYTLTSGSSMNYTRSASFFGVKLSTETEYNRNHFEKITAGNGKLEHDIWGAKGPVWGNAGVLYSF
ncbi:hypothetical protein [Streptomyces sp. NPDC005435]|uniref:hypothetical protein n=1 Tax=Streptomyces sp. NPDC005435 TaxID=3154464 RepID=UPI0034544E19